MQNIRYTWTKVRWQATQDHEVFLPRLEKLVAEESQNDSNHAFRIHRVSLVRLV